MSIRLEIMARDLITPLVCAKTAGSYVLSYSAHNQKHKRCPGGVERTTGQKPSAQSEI